MIQSKKKTQQNISKSYSWKSQVTQEETLGIIIPGHLELKIIK